MEQYAQINGMFWNGSPYQWVFYASILLILIFDRRKVHRLVFGVFPIMMLVVIFNPVSYKVVSSVLRRSNQYYVRLFSVIPVLYCMAYGLTLALNKVRGVVKLVGVCTAVGFIAFVGHSIYREPWMQRAENPNKVPDAVFDVLDAIPREKENVKVAFPDPLYVYARQVDGSITMPYGRRLDGVPISLLEALNAPVPDAAAVMDLAGRDSADYVVVDASDEAREAFSRDGFEPVAQAAGYLVYPVVGVPKVEMVMNEKRQIVSTTSMDAQGRPAFNNNSVITTYTFAYDRWGNRIQEFYYDKDGQRVTTVDGYSGRKKSYVLHGMAWVVNSVVNLDSQDNAILSLGRYETRYRFLHRRDLIEESYYDLDGMPMNRQDTGYAASLIQYDDRYRILSEKYLDAVGNLTMGFDGYAGFERTYDNNNHITMEKYFDTQLDLVDNHAGFATWNRSYDKRGNLVEEAFLDSNGNPVDIRGLIKRDTTFDLLQQVHKESVENSVGVGYRWNEDGSCTVIGDARGISWNNIIMAEKPFYFLNGETYKVEYSAKNVILRIYFYERSTWANRIGDLETTGDTEFTVPQNCGAMIIRLWVAPGVTVNEIVHPRIYIKPDGD